MALQAEVRYIQRRLEEARSETLGATDIFEKLGAVEDLESCRGLLRWIEEEINDPIGLYFDGELLDTALLLTLINSSWPPGVWKALDATVSHVYPDLWLFSGASSGTRCGLSRTYDGCLPRRKVRPASPAYPPISAHSLSTSGCSPVPVHRSVFAFSLHR